MLFEILRGGQLEIICDPFADTLTVSGNAIAAIFSGRVTSGANAGIRARAAWRLLVLSRIRPEKTAAELLAGNLMGPVATDTAHHRSAGEQGNGQ